MVRQLPDRYGPSGKQLRALLIALIVACAALLAGRTHAADPGVQTTWRLLDYIAVDYSGAVSGGRIVNQLEYDEMLEFSASVRSLIAALPATPARSASKAPGSFS